MASAHERVNSALVVIDVQKDVVAVAHDRDRVVATISRLVDRARAEDASVIWVQHNDEDLPSGTAGWELVDELVPLPDELVVHKNFRDSFEGTRLEEELADRGVGRLVVTGAQSDHCVRWTLHSALTRGYDTILVADAHTTDEVSPEGWPPGAELITHANATWASQAQPGRSALVVESIDVRF